MGFRTAKARVGGLGSAGQGTHHWWAQRLSSVALLPLVLLWVVPFAGALGSGHAAVLALYGQPLHAVVAVLLLGTVFHHLAQGLQVVVEDYVHHRGWRTALLIGARFLCGAAAVAGIFAVLRIALAA